MKETFELIVLGLAFCLLAQFVVRTTLEVRRKKSQAQPKPETPAPPAVQPQVHPCAVMHEWVTINVQPLKMDDLARTVALLFCSRCKLHACNSFIGSWTLEDFLKTKSDLAADLTALNRMAGL